MTISDLWERAIQLIDVSLYKMGLPINDGTRAGLFIVVVLVILAVAYILTDFLVWLSSGLGRVLFKKNEPDQKEEKEELGNPLKKIADLKYYEVLPPQSGQAGWRRTGRGISGICLSKRRSNLAEARELFLVIRFNGDWFLFKEPKSLVSYELSLFDKEAKRGGGREDLEFDWSSQPMKIYSEYRADYEVEVGGHYPHLIQNEKRVFLLLAEFEEDEINDGIEDRFLLFEEIGLIGGIAWQGRKVHVWTGDRLTEEEIAEVGEKYLDMETEEVLFDIEEMY